MKEEKTQFLSGDSPQSVVAEVNQKMELWRTDKRPYEIVWFITAAFTRGLQYAVWNDFLQKVETKEAPSHRIRLTVNRILPKYKARQAKFLKNKFDPQVVPASTDREDQLNAKATKLALDYTFRKEGMERKYREALNWSNICGKAFMWFYWDANKKARVKDPFTGQVVEDSLGDVCVSVSSPFEVLVADSSISNIGAQPEIMRVRQMSLSDIYARYPKLKGVVQAEDNSPEIFHYKQQIATVNSRSTGLGLNSASSSEDQKKGQTALVKEHFTAPNGKYPQGRYVVVIGEHLARYVPELPYKLYTNSSNPYPVVEFPDMEVPGQFWPPTLLEQLIGVQKEYNLLRSKLAEQIRIMAHPKVLVPAQAQFPEGSWTCVDAETSVLTKEGWKNYETLTTEDEVLSYDPTSQNTRWCKNLSVNVHEFEGELYSLRNRNIDALVTDNHRWLVQTRQPDRPFQQVVLETEDLLQEPKGKWAIPRVPKLLDNTPTQCMEHAEEWFELLGWVAAEGCYVQNTVKLTQIKPVGRERIKFLLDKLQIKYSENARGFGISTEFGRIIRAWMPEKIPLYSWLSVRSQSELQALLQGLVAGDGTVTKKGARKFFNNNLALCDIVQTIGTFLGLRTSRELSKPAQKKYFGENYGNQFYNCADQYVVYLGGTKKSKRQQYRQIPLKNIEVNKQFYKGIVWCPTVETGFVVYKRNNRIYISGNSEPGEVVRYLTAPGLPAPQVINFPNIASDVWNALKLIKEEFDELTNLYPASQGAVGQATSGFQTNLLQEAVDSIHAPDIRLHEMAMEEACYKIRRIMADGYDIPRLLSVTSRNLLPDVIEFSQQNIDENAEIVVWAGSALSNSPAVRTQQVLELWGSGLLSGNGDPEKIRQTLKLINMNGIGELQESTARDEQAARLENESLKNGQAIQKPLPWENHQIHWETHADFLKSPEAKMLPPELYEQLVEHLIFTERYINPNQAMTTALELGRQDLVPMLQPPAPPPPTPQMQGQTPPPPQVNPNQPPPMEGPPTNQ